MDSRSIVEIQSSNHENSLKRYILQYFFICNVLRLIKTLYIIKLGRKRKILEWKWKKFRIYIIYLRKRNNALQHFQFKEKTYIENIFFIILRWSRVFYGNVPKISTAAAKHIFQLFPIIVNLLKLKKSNNFTLFVHFLFVQKIKKKKAHTF